MKRWIIILKDWGLEDKKKIRKERFAEHFSFLQSNFNKIIFSCGLNDVNEDSETSFGGLWIVEAESKQDVIELLRKDPYFDLGLREHIDIFRAHEGYI